MAVFGLVHGVSPSPAASRLCRDLASGTAQRLLMSIAGSSSIRRLQDCPLVVDLDELAPVGGRATSGRDRWWLERFAEVCERLTSRGRSHPGLRPLANLRFEVGRLLPAVFSEPDVTATVRALKWKLLPHPGHEFRPRFCATCHASVACDVRRSSLPCCECRSHARRSRPLGAFRRSRSPAT